MNTFVLFDYIFYRIAYFEEKNYYHITGGEFSGIIYLSAFQFLNVLSLLDIFKPIDNIIRNQPLVFILGFVFIWGLNFFRYQKIVKYTELSLKWEKETRKIRIIKAICILCYFSLSFFLFFYLLL